MATLATLPALPLPGKPTQLVFTATANGNLVKVWCTSAPRGSKLRKALDESQSERVVVISESDISKRPQYTFDVGGTYVLALEEFQKGAENYGGRYKGDPDGFRTEALVDSSEPTISVASLLTAELGVQPDTAKLQVYVSGANIIETTIAVHGFTSPAIEKPTNERAKAAADAEAVTEALAELGGISAAGAIGTLKNQINDWIGQFNGHIADATFHANADSDNAVAYSFRNPGTLKAAQRSLAECLKRFLNHIQNIDPNASTPDPGSASYHQISGNNRVDWDNLPLAAGGGTMGACRIMLADLQRCYTGHQVSDVHAPADTDWNLSTLAALQTLHVAFLAELAAIAPTAPENEHPAKVLLVSGAGFQEA